MPKQTQADVLKPVHGMTAAEIVAEAKKVREAAERAKDEKGSKGSE